MTLLPPDSDERVFLRVVEAGSLKAAAEQLGHDPSAISRRLAALEHRLGQQLLRRSTRGSQPTEAGARYYEGLGALVDQQDALEAAVAGAGDDPQGLLRVSAPPEFGVRFVVPVLERLSDEHEALRVELALGTGFADLHLEDIDVAIRIGHLRDSALTARRLGVVPRVIAAAPRYLRKHGTPKTLHDLADHDMLGYRAASRVHLLRCTSPDGQARELRTQPRFTVNAMNTLVRMVEAGKGIYYGPIWAVANALQKRRVRPLLEDHALDALPVHAVYRDRRYLPAKTRVFIDAIAGALADEPSLRKVDEGEVQ